MQARETIVNSHPANRAGSRCCSRRRQASTKASWAASSASSPTAHPLAGDRDGGLPVAIHELVERGLGTLERLRHELRVRGDSRHGNSERTTRMTQTRRPQLRRRVARGRRFGGDPQERVPSSALRDRGHLSAQRGVDGVVGELDLASLADHPEALEDIVDGGGKALLWMCGRAMETRSGTPMSRPTRLRSASASHAEPRA